MPKIMESVCLRLKSKILSRLPVELIPDILSLLPIENLLRLRCCNKGFRHLIDDPYFRKLVNDRVIHHSSATTDDDHTVINFFTLIQLNSEIDCEFHFAEYDDSSSNGEEYKVTQQVTYPPLLNCWGNRESRDITVGSCNGLICRADFRRIEFDPIYIFNPVTREELKLPPLRFKRKCFPSVAHGFGYHPVTKEYKVVRIYHTVFLQMTVKNVEVYTLGTGVWRSIGVPSLFKTISFGFWASRFGVLVNGALHWISCRGNIASFDLETEGFHLIPSPSSFQPVDDHMWYNICALADRLCVFYHIIGVSTRVDIWALNKDQSWTKEYNIAVEINPGTPLSSNDDSLGGDYIYPITLTKSGKLLLWYNDKILVSYDLKNGERKIHGQYIAGYSNEVVVHVKSFVSLKALGEKNAKITRIRNQRHRNQRLC